MSQRRISQQKKEIRGYRYGTMWVDPGVSRSRSCGDGFYLQIGMVFVTPFLIPVKFGRVVDWQVFSRSPV